MDIRELLVGVKQWKPDFELPSEQLPEIFCLHAAKKVDADGILPLPKEGYKISFRYPYLMSV